MFKNGILRNLIKAVIISTCIYIVILVIGGTLSDYANQLWHEKCQTPTGNINTTCSKPLIYRFFEATDIPDIYFMPYLVFSYIVGVDVFVFFLGKGFWSPSLVVFLIWLGWVILFFLAFQSVSYVKLLKKKKG